MVYMSDRKSATKRAREATTPLDADDAGTLTVGVRELRDHLSRYLAEVKAGRSIAVTEHGTVIGTIVPMRFSERTMQLYREGKVNLPTLPKRPAERHPARPRRGRDPGHPPRGQGRVSTCFDASALVKLLLDEDDSDDCGGAVDGHAGARSPRPWGTRSSEAPSHGRSAAGGSRRDAYPTARLELERLWGSLVEIRLERTLPRHAGVLADRHGLGALDAIHLASALEHRDTDRTVRPSSRSTGGCARPRWPRG